MAVSRMVGARVRRKEDPRLITGAGTYVDDVRRVDMAYLELVRSPYAHARINSIDVSAAREMDGVIDVFVWDDIKDDIGPIPLDAAPSPDMLKPPRQALASGKARMLGDAVAAVVAEDRYVARDAAEAVEVDYEPLDAVVDVEAAIEEGAPLIWEDLGSNMAFRIEPGSENIDEALAEADNVFSFRYVNQRLIPNPMETRGVVVEPVGGGGLTMWSSTQIPHMLKDRLAAALRIPSNQIRVIAPEVGGGFGCKLNVYPEEYCTALAALRSNRPVKWIEDRSESFLATTHGRGQVNYIDVGVNDDGKVLAIKTKIIADLGAYYQILTAAVPTLSQLMMTGPYDIQAASSELICVFTNKSPTDAYRGAGRPEATYFLERALDQTAQKLDMDPAELRRKNLIPADQFPYAAPSGVEYDSGDHVTALDKAMEAIDYQGFRGRQAAALEEGRYLGIGVSSYTEICGFGPSNTLGMACWESGTVKVDRAGKVTVLTGASPHGQGQETSFAQIVADDLGVPFDDVIVLHGDTTIVPYGVGTFGSRATVVGGTALRMSTDKVIEKAKLVASHLLEAAPEDMVFQNGAAHVRGAPSQRKTLAEIAEEAHEFQNVPRGVGVEPGLEATSIYDPDAYTFPFGTHIATVEVDVETGKVKLGRYVAVDDCGRVINPMLVDGQRHGGIVQGIGQALFEGAVYDEDGQLLSGSLMDYAIPIASELVWMETDRTETPTPANPLGIKGIGEAGTIAAAPAIVNAVVDALESLGIEDIDMPLSPQNVWHAIQSAANGA